MINEIESAVGSFSFDSVWLSKIPCHGTPGVFIHAARTTGTTRWRACASNLPLAIGLILNSRSL
jgi:hypothetical protein